MFAPETARQIEIQGSRLNAYDIGQGPVVVLGSSFLWDAHMWAPQAEALSKTHRVIVPELWGHGGSGPMPAGTTDLAALARQNLELLDQLGVERFTLIGLSAGGMWGAELAMLAPERMSALVLMDTSLAAEPEATRSRYFAMLGAVEAMGVLPPPVLEATVPLFFSPTVAERKPELPAAFAARLRDWPSARLTDSVVPLGRLIFGRRDALADLGKLTLPTLVITGADDVARPPAEGREMAERLNTRFVEVAQAGHISTLEQPELVTRMLVEFLAEHGV